MFKIQEIREMIKLVNESNIEHLEIEEGDSKISLRKNGIIDSAVIQEHKSINLATSLATETPFIEKATPNKEISQATNQAAVTIENPIKEVSKPNNQGTGELVEIVSPMVGTFYRAPAVDAAPFVKVGDKVEPPTVVCILEAMKLFNEIEAEIDGEIVEVLVENGQLVEHGQPLFIVKKTS